KPRVRSVYFSIFMQLSLSRPRVGPKHRHHGGSVDSGTPDRSARSVHEDIWGGFQRWEEVAMRVCPPAFAVGRGGAEPRGGAASEYLIGEATSPRGAGILERGATTPFRAWGTGLTAPRRT